MTHEADEAFLTGLLGAGDGLQNAMDATADEATNAEPHAIFDRLHAIMDSVPGFGD